MKSARVTSLSLLLLLVPLTASTADRFDTVREAIRERMVERNIHGFVIAVWKDGEVLWEEGFGWADRDTACRPPSTPSDQKQILSHGRAAPGAMS